MTRFYERVTALPPPSNCVPAPSPLHTSVEEVSVLPHAGPRTLSVDHKRTQLSYFDT